jgi:hypothetical protein
MHIHKPKPLHGVREFLSEIGVIVVGVLIALGLDPNNLVAGAGFVAYLRVRVK